MVQGTSSAIYGRKNYKMRNYKILDTMYCDAVHDIESYKNSIENDDIISRVNTKINTAQEMSLQIIDALTAENKKLKKRIEELEAENKKLAFDKILMG